LRWKASRSGRHQHYDLPPESTFRRQRFPRLVWADQGSPVRSFTISLRNPENSSTCSRVASARLRRAGYFWVRPFGEVAQADSQALDGCRSAGQAALRNVAFNHGTDTGRHVSFGMKEGLRHMELGYGLSAMKEHGMQKAHPSAEAYCPTGSARKCR